MKINNLKYISFFILVLLISCISAFAEIEDSQKSLIQDRVEEIFHHVNEKDFDSLRNLVSTGSADVLINNIQKSLSDENIEFSLLEVKSVKKTETGQIEASTSLKKEGPTWSLKGTRKNFTFEKSNGTLLLSDTNFHVNPSFPSKFSGALLIILFLTVLFFFIFWIWMLIDCIKRDFSSPNEKIAFLLLIILSQGIGSILYFFLIKRKYDKN
ncbi:MAG: PLD nuclease N-terminal domain-containing protein [Elusimicrobiota bacterium]